VSSVREWDAVIVSLRLGYPRVAVWNGAVVCLLVADIEISSDPEVENETKLDAEGDAEYSNELDWVHDELWECTEKDRICVIVDVVDANAAVLLFVLLLVLRCVFVGVG
jgi:hypothetical protein